MTAGLRNTAGLFLCLALFAHLPQALAGDGGARLDSAGSVAVGAGFEVSHGDYGMDAGATLVSMPLHLFFSPQKKIDISLEFPLLLLSRRVDSGVVVTQTGGLGRRRADNRPGPASTTVETVQESGVGDIDATIRWTLWPDAERLPTIRSTLYVKLPTGDLDRGLGTGTVEGGPGLSVSKWIGDLQLFGEGAYILQNSRSDYPGRNYASYLGGVGMQATDRLFLSLLAKGSSARSEGAEAQAEGRLKVNYMQSRRISWELYGSAGFSSASPDYGSGIGMTYRF